MNNLLPSTIEYHEKYDLKVSPSDLQLIAGWFSASGFHLQTLCFTWRIHQSTSNFQRSWFFKPPSRGIVLMGGWGWMSSVAAGHYISSGCVWPVDVYCKERCYSKSLSTDCHCISVTVQCLFIAYLCNSVSNVVIKISWQLINDLHVVEMLCTTQMFIYV